MFQRLVTFFKHRWLDESDTRRIIGPDVLGRLTALVASSEKEHSGEIRICVESSLPAGYLWRHLAQNVPMSMLVRQRAMMIFSKLGVWDTADNNGVLIYLLLAERQIELVADRGVNAVVDDETWSAMVQRMSVAFAAGRFAEGLAAAVTEVSTPLKRHFAVAPAAGNLNELPDTPALG